MKDFLGKELEVGDSVIYIEPGYKNLTKGKILKITDKRVRITDYHDRNGIKNRDNTVIRRPEDVVIYDKV